MHTRSRAEQRTADRQRTAHPASDGIEPGVCRAIGGLVASVALVVCVAACGSSATQQGASTGAAVAPPSGSSTAAGPAVTSPHTPSSGVAASSTDAATTKQEAGRIVTDKYGGKVISVESDHERGQPTWEVEVKNSRQGRIEVDVAKESGEILKIEHEED